MIKLPYYKKVTEDVPVGDSKMLRIRLNPKYENHEGTVTHEETHIQHWYIGFIICLCIAIAVSFVWGWNVAMWFVVLGVGLKDLLYTFSRKARLKMEVAAYKNQIAVEDGDYSELYAEYLASPLYDLNISKAQALRLLRKQ